MNWARHYAAFPFTINGTLKRKLSTRPWRTFAELRVRERRLWESSSEETDRRMLRSLRTKRRFKVNWVFEKLALTTFHRYLSPRTELRSSRQLWNWPKSCEGLLRRKLVEIWLFGCENKQEVKVFQLSSKKKSRRNFIHEPLLRQIKKYSFQQVCFFFFAFDLSEALCEHFFLYLRRKEAK